MTTLICGSTGAVGSALSRILTSSSVPVALTSTCSEKLSALASSLPSPPSSTHVVDFTSPETVSDQLASLDVKSVKHLVYCVGNARLKPLRSITPEEVVADFNLNCASAITTVQTVLPGLKKNKGSVTLFSTVAVRQGFARHVSVSSAKGAVEGLTLSLAAELAPHVRVNCVAPSLIDGSNVAAPFTGDEKMKAAVGKMHPLQRLGDAEGVAKAAAFLSGEDAGWVTGQVWGVDGGRSTLR